MKDRGLSHSLPASPELVAAFLAELAEEGKSVATLRPPRTCRRSCPRM